MQTTDLDDYWQREEYIARLPLPPQDYEQDLFILWHQSRERYGKDHHEIGVHDAAKWVFTFVRNQCSRSGEIRIR